MRLNNKLGYLSTSVMLVFSQMADAGTDIFFNPLTQSAAVATVLEVDEVTTVELTFAQEWSGASPTETRKIKKSHPNELSHPWQAPAGVSQTNLTSMAEIEGDTEQSVVRVPGIGNIQSMWDMVSFDPTGRYIFIPHETPMGAGATRYDTDTDKAVVLFAGDTKGVRGETSDWTNDWGAFDPSTFTPNGTVLFGEEWSGLGRIIEIINPLADPQDIVIRELESIPNVSHEGLRFSPDGQTLYFVDEWNSGSLYKIVFQNTADYTAGGQVFVLSVNGFNGDVTKNWNDDANANAPRTGAATWVALTDAQGNASTQINPFKNGISSDCSNPDTFGGRCAADEAGGTPYGRPEDMEVGTLPDGTVIIYFAATSERTVYSVKEMANNTADVQVFASDANTPKNLGYPATTGEMNSPDNLAQDALGNIYIIEDAPNGSNVGGDIWFGRDTNNDGIAESIDHFMSIVADGAEATGMIFNPANPSQFVVAVQHPDSTNIDDYPEGFGDALWLFDLTNVVPPPCTNGQGTVRTCTVEQGGSEVNFISSLENTGN